MTQFTVLGGGGYIGSHLVRYLQSQGHLVWAPARGDRQIFNRRLGCVLYCVGMTGNFRTRPFDTVDAHVGLLAEVLENSDFDSLLYLSSTRVYLASERTEEDFPLVVEPENPSYLYNLTKLTGESLCHSSQRLGVRVARLSNVVGPGMSATSGNFVAVLEQEARAGHITLRSHPDSAKDYIHIEDVVRWLPLIALHGKTRTYNVASGQQTTHAQWLTWFEQATGCSYAIANDATPHSFPLIAVARLQQEFSVQPRPIQTWLT